MIVFDLRCSNGHSFEAWFNSNDDYINQNDKGLLVCPYCDCNKISKKLSALKIKSSDNQKKSKENFDITSLRKKFFDYVNKNTEDVGKKFPEIARKIHYNEIEPKPIRGNASVEEVKDLHDEGINVVALPNQADDKQLN
jgi:hypothetical protein